MLTQPEVAAVLPANLRSSATQDLVDKLNNASADPVIAQQIRENFITFTTVLKEGKYKLADYLSAVKYVSFKHMGLSNQDAYKHTFPDRYQDHLTRGTSPKDFSAYVAAFHKGKLVNSVMEQSLIPSWILNQDAFQRAINVNLEIMDDDEVSPKVRVEAANSILTHLKRPEPKQLNVQLGASEASGMSELRATLTELAQKQVQLIESGVSTKQIAGTPLAVDAEFTEIDADQAEPGRVAGQRQLF